MDDRRLLESAPLPIACAWRRCRNASEVRDRHDAGYYLFEILLKYLASIAIARYLAGKVRDHRVNAALKGLARPSLGEWLKFLRECVGFLAGSATDDRNRLPQPRTASGDRDRDPRPSSATPEPLVAALCEAWERKESRGAELLKLYNALRAFRTGSESAKEQVSLEGLLDEVVAYRNRVLGHGALLELEHYGRFADLFAHAFPEALDRAQVVTGLKLVRFDAISVEAGSRVECSVVEFMGQHPIRGEKPHVVAYGQATPVKGSLYLLASAGELLLLDPLLVAEKEDVFFLNEAQGAIDYLSYATGAHHKSSDAATAQADLFERILGYRPGSSRLSKIGDEIAAAESVAAAPEKDAQGQIGDYKIVREIGRGAMGVVYEAVQVSLGRRVALKVLPGSFRLDSRRVERFHREARATARIHHPSIVPVYEVGEAQGTHFYAMELIDGRALDDLLAETRAKRAAQPKRGSSGSDAAWIERTGQGFAELAAGLQEAHKLGLVHRDVKPSNILVEPDGRHVLVDFGLVREEEAGTLTRSGEMVGTLGYMSPEQVSRGAVDARADVYSLGATLYEALTQKPPHERETEHELQRAILFEEPRPARKLNPRLHRDLETILQKALEKNPERRYASAGEMAKDLKRFLRYEPIQARPQSLLTKLSRHAARHKGKLSAAAAVLVLGLATVAVLSLSFGLRAQYHLAESHLIRGQLLCEQGEIDRGLHWIARAFEEAPLGSEPLRDVIRMNLGGWRSQWTPPHTVIHTGNQLFDCTFSPDGRQVAVGDFQSVRLWLVETGEPVGTLLDAKQVSTTFSPDGKRLLTIGGEPTAKLWAIDSGELQRKPLQEWVGVADGAFHPDGKRVLIAGIDGNASIWSLERGERLGKPLEHPSELRAAAFSADGSRILARTAAGKVWLWQSESGEPVLSPLKYEAVVKDAALTPDGKWILTGSDDRTARLWSAQTGAMVGRPLQHEQAVRRVVLSPDGRRALTANPLGAGKAARLWSLETYELLCPPFEHGDFIQDVEFSSDGRLVLTGSHDRTARLWSAETGEPVGSPMRHDGYLAGSRFSPKADWVATMSPDTAKIWRVEPAGPKVRRFRQPEAWGLAWSDNGAQVVVGGGDGRVQVWSVETATAIGAPLKHGEWVWTVAFSPDGQRLATGSLDKTVRFWSAKTGERLGLTLTHPADVREVAFSSDGKKLATACFDGAARIWSTETGDLLSPLLRHDGFVEDVAVSPDGKLLLTGSGDHTARLWSVETGEPVGQAIFHRESVLAVAFSPNGKLLATGSRDGAARLWSVATMKPVGRPLSHSAWVEDLEFSPDGELLLTGCADGAARLWSVATGHRAGPTFQIGATVMSVAFSPDGTRIAASGNDDVRVWDLPPRLDGDAASIRTWTEAQTGREMDTDGVFRWLEPTAWRERKERAAREMPPSTTHTERP